DATSASSAAPSPSGFQPGTSYRRERPILSLADLRLTTNMLVDILGQRLHAFGKRRDLLGQLGILLEQHQRILSQLLTVLGIRVGPHLVTLRLAGLGQQDERRRIRGLQAERQVEQDERIGIEADEEREAIANDPEDHQHSLTDQILR